MYIELNIDFELREGPAIPSFQDLFSQCPWSSLLSTPAIHSSPTPGSLMRVMSLNGSSVYYCLVQGYLCEGGAARQRGDDDLPSWSSADHQSLTPDHSQLSMFPVVIQCCLRGRVREQILAWRQNVKFFNNIISILTYHSWPCCCWCPGSSRWPGPPVARRGPSPRAHCLQRPRLLCILCPCLPHTGTLGRPEKW